MVFCTKLRLPNTLNLVCVTIITVGVRRLWDFRIFLRVPIRTSLVQQRVMITNNRRPRATKQNRSRVPKMAR